MTTKDGELAITRIQDGDDLDSIRIEIVMVGQTIRAKVSLENFALSLTGLAGIPIDVTQLKNTRESIISKTR